jgi:hypothetical protein
VFISGEKKWHCFYAKFKTVFLEKEMEQNQEVISYTERNRMPFDAVVLLDVMKVVLVHILPYHGSLLFRLIISLGVLLYV